jgi:hypothetical protein
MLPLNKNTERRFMMQYPKITEGMSVVPDEALIELALHNEMVRLENEADAYLECAGSDASPRPQCWHGSLCAKSRSFLFR